MTHVNIAIPTFNRCDLLRQALNSALAQDYGDFSITVLDNASQDDTRDVVCSYKDRRVDYQRNECNIGQLRNWNRLLERNTSEYILVLQDDDLIEPNFISNSVAVLETNSSAGFSFTDCAEIDASGSIISHQKQGEKFAPGLVDGTDYLRRIVAGENLVIHVSSVLMRTKALQEVGPFDAEHSRTSIDFNLYFRLAARFDLAFVPESLARIRRHEGAHNRVAEVDSRPMAMLAERMDACASLFLAPGVEELEYREWLVERMKFLSLQRSIFASQLVPEFGLEEEHKRALAAEEIMSVVPPGDSVVLVDDGQFWDGYVPDRRVLPFLERDGVFWGAPGGDEAAVDEVERLRDHGARFLIFLWPAFWWYDYFHGLREHLLANFKCVLRNSRIIAFAIGK